MDYAIYALLLWMFYWSNRNQEKIMKKLGIADDDEREKARIDDRDW